MDTPKRPRGRPATGQTPKRYLRMGALWDEAQQIAAAGGETVTALVTRAVEREVRQRRRELQRSGSAPTPPGPFG